jgi:hypothetical protein
VSSEVLEGEAIEEAGFEPGSPAPEARPLPAKRSQSRDLAPAREVGTVAIAAAGGLVAGAATVVAMRAARSVAQPRRRSVRKRAKDALPGVVASRSFLIDVHLLDR